VTRTFTILLACFCLITATASHAQRGAITVPRGLDELTGRAENILRGHIVEAHVEPDPKLKNLMTVVVKMKVDKTLKGKAVSDHTFRQFIWDIRDQYDAARYQKGQELLLLLNPVSENGLTSPTGMDQGRFRILRTADGKATAVNGTHNVGLFDGVAQRTAKRGVRFSAKSAALLERTAGGPVPLDQLEEVISTIASTK